MTNDSLLVWERRRIWNVPFVSLEGNHVQMCSLRRQGVQGCPPAAFGSHTAHTHCWWELLRYLINDGRVPPTDADAEDGGGTIDMDDFPPLFFPSAFSFSRVTFSRLSIGVIIILQDLGCITKKDKCLLACQFQKFEIPIQNEASGNCLFQSEVNPQSYQPPPFLPTTFTKIGLFFT